MAATTHSSVLQTANESFGFYNTMQEQAPQAWPAAFTAIAKATGAQPQAVLGFLDSTNGRHFADSVQGFLSQRMSLQQAIEASINRWQGWKIDRRTSRKTGLRCAAPYLIALVSLFAA